MKKITIVGGGLSGLFLGLHLRRHGVPVRVIEAGQYPRHRVCGEFINGQGVACLRENGLISTLEQVGARWARTAQFFLPDREGPVQRLPDPALCLTRYVFDQTLAKLFVDEGGQLECGQRVSTVTPSEGMVWAAGRRPPSLGSFPSRWYGLKCHAADVELGADLELHFAPGGYVGLCRLKHGLVNVCGLFLKGESRHARPADPVAMLRGKQSSLLYHRLASAKFDSDSFCAVAGLEMRPRRCKTDFGVCRVGDAVTMIPPLTGNGMSMAFESASLASPPIMKYCEGRITWAEALRFMSQAIDQRFRSRLRWANILQNLLMSPKGQKLMLLVSSRFNWVWQAAFHNTR